MNCNTARQSVTALRCYISSAMGLSCPPNLACLKRTPAKWSAVRESLFPASTLVKHRNGVPFGVRTIMTGRVREIDETDNLPKLYNSINNGEKFKPIFSKEEMDNRVSWLRSYMQDNDIGGALFTSMPNVKYLSDFLYCSVGRNYGLVVTHDKVVTISALVDGGMPWRRISPDVDNVVYTDWHRDNFWHAVKRELEGVSGKIGCEFDHLTLENKARLDLAVINKEVVDVGVPMMKKRMVKTQEEIALVTEGARICDIGGYAFVEALEEGATEYELSNHVTSVIVKEIATKYPDTELRDSFSLVQSGIHSDGAHNYSTTRRIHKGDIVSLNVFPVITGYYTALERTLFLDYVPSDRHLEIWEQNCEVHRRGMELIKPGVRCCDVAQQLNEICLRNDVFQYRSFGYGHSLGIMSFYYGREAALEFREDIETVLEPGMVVTMEPMITVPEGQPGAGGYREHNIMILTEDGARNVTNFPFGPEHNIIKK